ncbi:MAG TPA: four helix bundle protein [Planctomycetota bacterium]|nr:four helix bundle protein [Planctomycetota bacterium]
MTRQFDHEKLDVYQLELKFIAWADILIGEVEAAAGRRVRHVTDHLDRASLSMLFNTAEGNGKRQRFTRGKFFDDARGSTAECAGCLDALVAKRACPVERIGEGKEMLVRIFEMLTKLVERFSTDERVGEDEMPYGGPSSRSRTDKKTGFDDDDEDDDEDE